MRSGSSTRFELEQDILRCWGIVDELRLLYEQTDGVDEDQLMNALLGMIQMSEWKFQKCFDTFERLLKEIPSDTINKHQLCTL